MIKIPEKELHITFSRSRGKGGQNVNKTSTKATLKWNVYLTQILSPEQKYKVIHELPNRINEKGELFLWSQKERSQIQNKNRVISVLHSMVNQVLIPRKIRKATKPSKASKEKRLRKKKILSEKKKFRRKIKL